jgi:hypothetical protein
MTTCRDLKALVRVRMEKTGERYAAARRHILNELHDHSPVDGIAQAPDGVEVIRVNLEPVVIRRFRSPDEAKSVRTDINDRAILPVSEFVDITGKCEFPRNHQVTCQLETETGVCDQEFGDGWVMRRSDGVEVFVGCVCAKRQFQKHIKFAQETVRARNDITVADLVTRLQDLLVDPRTKQRVQEAETRRIALLKQVEGVRFRMTHSVLERVRNLAKAVTSSIELEFEFFEKKEDRDGIVHTVSKWVPTVVAILAGPNAPDPLRFNRITRAIQKAEKALEVVQASTAHSARTLRSWYASIMGIADSELALDGISNDLAAFTKAENLRSLVWLGRSFSERVGITGSILRFLGESTVTEDMARAAYGQWEREMRAANGDRNFRVP